MASLPHGNDRAVLFTTVSSLQSKTTNLNLNQAVKVLTALSSLGMRREGLINELVAQMCKWAQKMKFLHACESLKALIGLAAFHPDVVVILQRTLENAAWPEGRKEMVAELLGKYEELGAVQA